MLLDRDQLDQDSLEVVDLVNAGDSVACEGIGIESATGQLVCEVTRCWLFELVGSYKPNMHTDNTKLQEQSYHYAHGVVKVCSHVIVDCAWFSTLMIMVC